MVKMLKVLAIVAILMNVLAVNIFADETLECLDEYKDMLDALPEEIAGLLPESLFSDSVEDISQGAKDVSSFGYILKVIAEYLGLELQSALKLLATLLGILIICAVMNSVKSSFSSNGIASVLSVCVRSSLFLTACMSQLVIVKAVESFFERLCIFANSLLALSGALYAMGGNVSAAVVNHSSLIIFINIVENLCSKSAVPIVSICIAFCAVSCIAPEVNIGGISGFFKRTYTTALTFIMTVFVTVMGAQNLIASKTDTLAGKAAKFAVGNLIPTVGSALAGTLGTVSTGVEYIRATVGTVGVVAIILMVVPIILTLLLTKLVFGILEGVADILDCAGEKKMITEMSSINGFLLACACISSVCLIFIMTLFVKCSAAIGGTI